MIKPFDFQEHIVAPWTELIGTYGWVAAMGFLVMLACGLLGNFLILRRMALFADAISHSILPGIVVAFLLGESRGPLVMFLGAVSAGLVTTLLIEILHRRSRLKQDAATGIVFSTLFAIGIVLLSLFAGKTDLDADCVLYGDLAFVALEPAQLISMGVASVLVIAFITVFYKELLVTCFDSALARSLGISPTFYHYALMGMLSVVVVSAFKAVGAILVVAAIVLPGATASLLSTRLPRILLLSALHAALSAVLGMHLGIWLDCSIGAAVVVAGAGLFCLAWVASALRTRFHRREALANAISAG